ncbi:hypothetical protein F4804DRAFT_339269 [Jackrogersella minutella]|nr:hypothetical protein F4804DRAFT_339269 [Jackrogersella minutella]
MVRMPDISLAAVQYGVPGVALVPNPSIHPILTATQSNILILFDASQAMPEPFDSETTGIVSVISATGSGPEDTLQEMDLGKLTPCLHLELEDLSRSTMPFSDVLLHSRLLRYLDKSSDRNLVTESQLNTDDQQERTFAIRQAPMHKILSSIKNPRPIYLGPLPKGRNHQAVEHTSVEEAMDAGSGVMHTDETDHSLPKVLVSLQLNLDMVDRMSGNEWTRWLLRVPSGIQGTDIIHKAGTGSGIHPSHPVPTAQLPFHRLSNMETAPSTAAPIATETTTPS